jgi:hypothetical protein
MFKGKTYIALFVLLLLALFLSACGGNPPTPAPASTATVVAAAPTPAAEATSNSVSEPTAAPTAQAEDTTTPLDTSKQSLAPTDTPQGEANAGEPTATTEATGAGGEPTATTEATGAGGEPTATAEVADTSGEPTPTTEVAQNAEEPTPTTEATGSGTSTTEGPMVADLGFRPEVNGFSFENYGGDTGRTNLEAADVQKMFGDAVCASQAGGNCILTPAAEQWMQEINKGMNGGHCEGFAALSLAFYADKEKVDQFGAPRTIDLKIDNNQALQREIAYYFATQDTQPAASGEIKKTPNEILDLLIEAFKNGASKETYTMGIYKRGFKDGHAITPYAVEDVGGGKFAVLVYDNNYPNATRKLTVDRNANSWTYIASINPNEPAAEYEGDATTGTLSLSRLPRPGSKSRFARSAPRPQAMRPVPSCSPRTSNTLRSGWTVMVSCCSPTRTATGLAS